MGAPEGVEREQGRTSKLDLGMPRHRKRRLVTRRRVKWAGLVATTCLALAMIESGAFWPSFYRSHKPPSVMWRADVVPGGVKFSKIWYWTSEPTINATTFAFDTRIAYEERTKGFMSGWWWTPDPYAWLPSYQTIGNKPEVSRYLVIPFWIPLVLVALPTAYLFWPIRKPKPGFCTNCRYDLRGLEGGVCPECGEALANEM